MQDSNRLDRNIPGPEEIDKAAAQDAIVALEIEKQGVYGSWAEVGRTLGGTWGALRDPVNLKMMAVSGLFAFRSGPGFFRSGAALGKNGVSNMGFSVISETIIQRNVDEYYEEMGIDHNSAEEITASGIGGLFAVGAQSLAGAVTAKIMKETGMGAALRKIFTFKNDAALNGAAGSGHAQGGAEGAVSNDFKLSDKQEAVRMLQEEEVRFGNVDDGSRRAALAIEKGDVRLINPNSPIKSDAPGPSSGSAGYSPMPPVSINPFDQSSEGDDKTGEQGK